MTMGQVAVELNRSDGVLSFYSAISASLLPQLTYSTARFRMYEALKKQSPSDQPLPFYQKALLAGFSGACGGFVGTPGDLVNITMQNDVKLPVAERRNYKHALYEREAVQEAEAETKRNAAVDDAAMHKMRNAFFNLQDKRTEKTYKAIMAQVTRHAEDMKALLTQITRYGVDNTTLLDQLKKQAEELMKRLWSESQGSLQTRILRIVVTSARKVTVLAEVATKGKCRAPMRPEEFTNTIKRKSEVEMIIAICKDALEGRDRWKPISSPFAARAQSSGQRYYDVRGDEERAHETRRRRPSDEDMYYQNISKTSH
ncbi:hypothetical protein ANCCEY_02421 [Ancylostoma ceylanicum]|uniref:Uncharacterized protein n=1 Tax=Ancylostoma ceylanicum TaxID=53326 RepID=A0A0D6M7R5_9BILA|nr:hypothetical protein ANCCEY_02421 [Ancylostoma ceylanicum]